jgi:ferredoxin-NADP reductase
MKFDAFSNDASAFCTRPHCDDDNHNHDHDSLHHHKKLLLSTPSTTSTSGSGSGETLLKNEITISVKRRTDGSGLVSTWLHDEAKIGAQLWLSGVAGLNSPFAANHERNIIQLAPLTSSVPVPSSTSTSTSSSPTTITVRRLLLLSAGIGITPMMAYIRAASLLPPNERLEIIHLHTERTWSAVPFRDELLKLSASSPSYKFIVNLTGSDKVSTSVDDTKSASSSSLSSPPSDVRVMTGRVNASMIASLIPTSSNGDTSNEQLSNGVWHIYYCGPHSYSDAIDTALKSLHVPADVAHTEEFDF